MKTTTCAFCGDEVALLDPWKVLVLHYVMSSESSEKELVPTVKCPFSGIDVVENFVYLTSIERSEGSEEYKP
jgi:hypothetical protein